MTVEIKCVGKHITSQQPPLQPSEPQPKLIHSKLAERPLSNTGRDFKAMLVEEAVHSDESLKLEEDQEYIAELTDQVSELSLKVDEERENARGWESKYKSEYECSAMWRDKYLDMERQRDKWQERTGIEMANRKEAERLMDETLIAAHRDEELLALLAEKFVNVRKRNEGEKL